jgi:hypothetical protein
MWTSIGDYMRDLSILGAINVNPYMVKLSAKLPGVAEVFKDLLQLPGCLRRTDGDALPGVRTRREGDAALLETLLYTVSQNRTTITRQRHPNNNSPFHNFVFQYALAAQQATGVTGRGCSLACRLSIPFLRRVGGRGRRRNGADLEPVLGAAGQTGDMQFEALPT